MEVSGMEEQVQGLGDGGGGNSVIKEQLRRASEMQWTAGRNGLLWLRYGLHCGEPGRHLGTLRSDVI